MEDVKTNSDVSRCLLENSNFNLINILLLTIIMMLSLRPYKIKFMALMLTFKTKSRFFPIIHIPVNYLHFLPLMSKSKFSFYIVNNNRIDK